MTRFHWLAHVFGFNLELLTVARDTSLVVRCKSCGDVFVLHGGW